MRSAFHEDTGPLTDKSAERSERQARSSLFAGAIRFTCDDGVLDVIERNGHEIGNLGHKSAFPRSHRGADAPQLVER